MNSKERLAAILAAKGRVATTSSSTQRAGAPSSEVQRQAAPRSTKGGQGEARESLGVAELRGPDVLRVSEAQALITGDAADVLRGWPEGCIDAFVTDPGIGAGEWEEGGCPPVSHFSAMYRVAKPGAHAAIFASRRRSHVVATRAEEAGWEIRDTLLWIYPKGMPMSLDIGPAVDKKLGGKGEPYFRTAGSLTDEQRARLDKANPWYGWGTELRPTWEPILLLRKPSPLGFAETAMTYGTGVLNIDATRIEGEERDAIATYIPPDQGDAHGLALTKHQLVVGKTTLGRWPADAIISHGEQCSEAHCADDCPVAALELQSAGAAKFFWCPKAARREKDAGVGPKGNTHPAVKPVALLEWLLSLICPPYSTVVDPYVGSGSCGVGAIRLDGSTRSTGRLPLNLTFVGIDRDPTWIEIARKRMIHELQQGSKEHK